MARSIVGATKSNGPSPFHARLISALSMALHKVFSGRQVNRTVLKVVARLIQCTGMGRTNQMPLSAARKVRVYVQGNGALAVCTAALNNPLGRCGGPGVPPLGARAPDPPACALPSG